MTNEPPPRRHRHYCHATRLPGPDRNWEEIVAIGHAATGAGRHADSRRIARDRVCDDFMYVTRRFGGQPGNLWRR